MTIYVGIDPGPKTNGLVVYHTIDAPHTPGVVTTAKPRASLDEVRKLIHNLKYGQGLTFQVVLEMTTPGPPSTTVHDTSIVCGRIIELCDYRFIQCHTVTRPAVRSFFRVQPKGADSGIRSEIIRRHPTTNGGHITRSRQSPLYGMSTHAWAALAVVLTHIGTKKP